MKQTKLAQNNKATPNRKINAKQSTRTSPKKSQKQDSIYVDLSTPTPEFQKEYSETQSKSQSQKETLTSRIKQKGNDIEIAPLDVSISQKEKQSDFERRIVNIDDHGEEIYEEK